MIDVANANLKGYRPSPEAEVQPSEEPLFFTITATELEDIITRAIQPLKDEVENLKAEVQRLKDAKPGITALRLDDAFEAIEQIDEHLGRIDRTRTTAPPQGSKTIARITKIDEVLKARGSTTLKELERILKIRPQEMSRILGRLDKRRYEIFDRNGKTGQKVIQLRARI